MSKPDPNSNESSAWTCPLPVRVYPEILLAHGGGGKLTQQLIDQMFRPAFQNDLLDQAHDGAVLNIQGQHLAFTTDSFVVRPLFFPGGDIGSLAVFGTVNDLAMCGAQPLYLSAGLILEEGFPMHDLQKIVDSMKAAAKQCGVLLVTGDTKVVEKNKGDGIYINTSGIGLVRPPGRIAPQYVEPGDRIIISGDLGRHGMAIMALREGLEFESPIQSDSAPLHKAVLTLLNAGMDVHCLRDLTRGGLASALNEIAASAGMMMEIEEKKIPVMEDVRGACEILGLDPLYVANEGRLVAFVAPEDEKRTLELLAEHEVTSHARVIGEVKGPEEGGMVLLKNQLGTRRILDMMTGEQLPRIC